MGGTCRRISITAIPHQSELYVRVTRWKLGTPLPPKKTGCEKNIYWN